MEKEALIDIILNDIKEVHALVNTFKGKNEINAAFINLTRTKIANISEELSLLEQLNVEKKTPAATESSLTSAALSASSDNDHSAIAESSSRFAQGESFIEMEAQPIVEEKSVEESAPTPMQVKEPIIEDRSAPIVSTDTTKQMEEVVAHPEANTTKEEPKQAEPIKETPQITTENIVHPEKEKPEQKAQTGIQTPIVSNPAPKSTKAAVLGEVINKDGSSLNEAMANRKSVHEDIKQIGKPVDDVRKAIGLNDRFYFQRELFSNNADLFNQTLDQINHLDSYDSAISFLQSNYSWEADNEACESFYKSIKRRFI